MKTIVTITDVTRMAPPFVCVAGVAEDRHSIRIQFKGSRIDENWLCNNGVTIIRPFAKVGFALLSAKSEPPHTEDWFVDPYLLEAHGQLTPAEQASFLASICDPSVATIFGTRIFEDPGFYVLKGRGDRSLGTVQVNEIEKVFYQCYEKGWDCRLRFRDEGGDTYLLKVKDLSFCAYLDHLREVENVSSEQIEKRLTRNLSEKECFLRIGLARGWAQFPDRCYLQVTGVFPFPDYLQGRWFGDFATPKGYQPGREIYTINVSKDSRVKEAPTFHNNYSTTPALFIPKTDSKGKQQPSEEHREIPPAQPIRENDPQYDPSRKQWAAFFEKAYKERNVDPTKQKPAQPETNTENTFEHRLPGWLENLKKFFKKLG
jgi:hypothetical protein